jgi:hypothetical protein
MTHIDDYGRLVFSKVPRTPPEKRPVIRVSEEAYKVLVDWEAKTGLTMSYVASEFIKYADDHSVIEKDE